MADQRRRGADPRREPRNPGRTEGAPAGHPVSWAILSISTMAILVCSIDRVILPTVLPDILKTFHLSSGSNPGTIAGGNILFWSGMGTAVGAIVLGALGDAFGTGPRRAWTWMIAVSIVVISGIVTTFNRTIGQLKLWRFIMGIGTGGMEPINVALLTDWWQKEDRGFAVGVHHTGFPIGQFFGPILIAAVVSAYSWRTSFLLIPMLGIPIMIAQVVVARRRNLRKVNEWIREQDQTPSADEEGGEELENPARATAHAASSRNLRLAVLVSFGLLFCEFGVTNFLTTELTSKLGLSLSYSHGFFKSAAVISGASGLTGWIGQIGFGMLSDRTGRKRSMYALSAGWAVAMLGLTLITNVWTAWALLLFWGLFRNASFPVIYTLLIDSVPESASAGMGVMVGLALGVSQIISGPISGHLIDSSGFNANYFLLAAVAAATLVPTFFIRETVTHEPGRAVAGSAPA
ncbi:MAG: MFS transporter [Solirubrobacteraceae bacterium]